MAELRRFLASVPRGFGDLLARELGSFGALDIRERGNAVAFTGPLAVAYRACLESWVAARVFLEIARFEAADDASIYAALRGIDWRLHVDPSGTLACEWSGRHPAVTNTHYGTLRLKDAICDGLRESTGQRPDIASGSPGVRIHAHAVGTQVTVSVDLAGEGLHRRGWRGDTGEAPLRENVAAGVLLRAGWPALAAEGAAFLDPMCGSGTFVIEAARMAAGFAANHRRRYFGFLAWPGHDAVLWGALVGGAEARAAAGLERWRADGRSPLRGRDLDARVLREAGLNAAHAGVAELVGFEVGPLVEARAGGGVRGLLCTNPPWGLRLGDQQAARRVHAELGAVLREHFRGWQAAVLTGDPSLGLELGLRASRVHTVWNGALECRLLRITVDDTAIRELRPGGGDGVERGPRIDPSLAETSGAQMFANRLRKNLKQQASWLKREAVSCHRIYDADMPEYAFAIDLYTAEPVAKPSSESSSESSDGDGRWWVVQEYEAPREIPEEAVRRRRSEALAGLVAATGVPPTRIRLRTRRRRKRGEQYSRREGEAERLVVREGGLRFHVNLGDYLDTGLFLDHRLTRGRLRDAARGVRFLNLFAYTGTATVYAAAGGARETTTVDLSATYLEWARDNMALNGFEGPMHRRVQADVREWLQAARARAERYELIFCDPPTFSNSKRMEGVFDVQRDHARLIDDCMALLAPDGLLVFSNNAQRFRLDPGLPERYAVRDIGRETLPPDYARNTHIHACFEVRHRAVAGPRTGAASR
jgi:23S rRNA (guanine2445-N2)-methyltransferase / 23S rRNA (guanine2069-N7)-methyltransferase